MERRLVRILISDVIKDGSFDLVYNNLCKEFGIIKNLPTSINELFILLH
jgi:hypothetical protein